MQSSLPAEPIDRNIKAADVAEIGDIAKIVETATRTDAHSTKVKPQSRLRNQVAVLSFRDEQQDRLRRLSRDQRPHIALGNHAWRRLARARQTQGLGSD